MYLLYEIIARLIRSKQFLFSSTAADREVRRILATDFARQLRLHAPSPNQATRSIAKMNTAPNQDSLRPYHFLSSLLWPVRGLLLCEANAKLTGVWRLATEATT